MNKIFMGYPLGLLSLILLAGFLILAPVAHATTPTLSLSTSGQSGDYVQVNVSGDPNASVFLFDGSNSGFLGNISSSGTGLFTVGSSALENQSIFGNSGISIATNQAVYIKTGGINGAMSNQTTWPTLILQQ